MPLTAEDREEMIELVARYNHAIDSRDAEAWADTFTEDGRFYVPPKHDVRGREALVAFIGSFARPAAITGRRTSSSRATAMTPRCWWSPYSSGAATPEAGAGTSTR